MSFSSSDPSTPAAKDFSMWWLDHVVLCVFNLAKGRHWTLKLFAMTFGTVWAAAMLLVGFPILVFDIARDVWRTL